MLETERKRMLETEKKRQSWKRKKNGPPAPKPPPLLLTFLFRFQTVFNTFSGVFVIVGAGWKRKNEVGHGKKTGPRNGKKNGKLETVKKRWS